MPFNNCQCMALPFSCELEDLFGPGLGYVQQGYRIVHVVDQPAAAYQVEVELGFGE